LAIQDGFQISEMGVIVVGKVESGSLVKGMEIVLIPSKARGKVSLIERRQEVVASAGPGDQIGFQIEGLTLKQVRRGYICCDAARHPLPPVTKFLAQLAVLSGASSLGHIKKGDKVRLDCHNTHMDVTFDSIDSGTKSLVPGDVACVTLVADEPIALDLFASCPPLGRFALRVKSHTVAVGLVTGLKPNTR
ncbi:Elongation factor 1-alpha 1, partial [Massospora cicadina]